ncbi:hypothetical protein HMPREF1548_03102 [Clostridium sp. KLE 1755]|nr:hypothetical protein HMPREF1548_03102 [Clostridium sp. KLE 1755]
MNCKILEKVIPSFIFLPVIENFCRCFAKIKYKNIRNKTTVK